MFHLNRIVFILLTLTIVLPLSADPDLKEQVGEELFAKYQAALKNQQDAVKNVNMEVLMEGNIPKLKKQGKMSALKNVSSVGRVTWKLLGFWGDDTVKKEVMARYMQAEQEAANKQAANKEAADREAASKDVANRHEDDKKKDDGDDDKKKSADISITADNYNLKYKGLNDRNNRPVHIFELKPKHKRVGLFKGELWLDPETFLPVREAGRLVKNPSVFVKKMEFIRDYEIRDGVAYLKRMESHTDTRLVGRANLSIEYANIQKQEQTVADEAVEEARAAVNR
jgi:hypothetical protein